MPIRLMFPAQFGRNVARTALRPRPGATRRARHHRAAELHPLPKPDQDLPVLRHRQSLAAGRTIERKTPEQLDEVAKAVVELDGVSHMVIHRDAAGRAAILAASAAAVKAAVNLPIQALLAPGVSPNRCSGTTPVLFSAAQPAPPGVVDTLISSICTRVEYRSYSVLNPPNAGGLQHILAVVIYEVPYS